MLPSGPSKLLVAILVCSYIAAVSMVIYLLADLQANRHGGFAVERVTFQAGVDNGKALLLDGQGFRQGLRAVVAAETDSGEKEIFLDGRFSPGLWTDGRTLLAGYSPNLLLNIRVGEDGSFHVLGSVVLPGTLHQVVKVGKRALVNLGPEGLWLVDLTDPARPKLIEKLLAPGSARSYARQMVVAGERVYAPSRDGTLAVVDLSQEDPDLSVLPIREGSMRAALYQQKLATGSPGGVLQLFDLDASGEPKPVGELSFDGDIRGVSINAAGLFVALGKGQDGGELLSFEVRDWPRLEMRSVLQMKGSILSVVSLPDRPLLLLSRIPGLVAVDVSDISNPLVGNDFRMPSTFRDFCVTGDKVLGLTRQSLTAFPLETVLAGTQEEGVVALDMSDFGTYAWNGEIFLLIREDKASAEDHAGAPKASLRAVRTVSDEDPCRQRKPRPAKPAEACLAISERRMAGVIHLFCEDPKDGSPRLESTIRVPNAVQVLWKDGRIYAVEKNDAVLHREQAGSLLVFDATDPRNPVAIASLPLEGTPRNLAWLEPHFLLVASGPSGLYVLDVADPARPVRVGHMPLPGHLQQIAQVSDVLVAGRIAYLTHLRNGVSLVNLEDPRNPKIEGMLNTHGYANRLLLHDDLLLASLTTEGFFLIDVGEEGAWAPVGVVETPFKLYDLAVCQDKVVVSGGPFGLKMIDLPRKLEVSLQGRHRARILLPEDLAPGGYRLYLYDETASQQIESAFRLETDTGRVVAQNE